MKFLTHSIGYLKNNLVSDNLKCNNNSGNGILLSVNLDINWKNIELIVLKGIIYLMYIDFSIFIFFYLKD